MTNSRAAIDINYHLHAYTNAQRNLSVGPLIIEEGEGIYVKDDQGKRYIEAMAGLWCVGVGFSEQRLIDVAVAQMKKLPFYHTFNHRSHAPVIDLARKLVSISPWPMSKAFFTSSGSEAVDTAIKLIWYRSNSIDEPKRKKIISRKNAYHGSTIAAGSLTGTEINQRSFDLPIANMLHTCNPHFWREATENESEQEFVARIVSELERLILAEGPETIAAFIGEPVMGAGGVIVPPAGYWEGIQRVLRKYDILLVVDEIICGFGRTGAMFGSTTFEIRPDVIVMSKQMSSAYMPIAALLINDKMYGPVAAESDRIGMFGHGFTSGGHPVAAAVALENINVIEERKLVANAKKIGAYMQERLREFTDHELVGEVRGVGLIAAVELVKDKSQRPPVKASGELGSKANMLMRENGVIVRNIVDSVTFCPPMIISTSEVDIIIDAFSRTLESLRHS